VGENGARGYANDIVAESDTLVVLGTAVESVWTAKWGAPADGAKTIVHADIDGAAIGKNYRTAVELIGDLRETLTALGTALNPMEKWHPDDLRRRHEEWLAPYAAAFDADAFPLRPERLVADTSAVLDDEAILVSDPGTSCPYLAALYEFPDPGRHWVTPRAHGALGYAIPGVVGAQYARPDATVVGFTGDGSFGMSTGDLETISRQGLPVTIVVLRNEAFSWIEAGQRNAGDFSFAVDFDGLDHAAIAREYGLDGYRVECPGGYERALEQAVASARPSVIDVPVQPLPDLDDAPVDWLEPDE
jgi:acetolactate synthase-1/2/3 large subunit